MTTRSPFTEVAELIKEAGGEALTQCYQCGSCSATCPWRDFVSFLPRRLFEEARLGLIDFETEAIWRCVTCNKCVQRCPRGVPIIEIMRSLRRAIIGMGIAEAPTSLTNALRNLNATGNPMGENREQRNDWVMDLNIKIYDENTEYLFFPCCTAVFDPILRKSVQSTAQILTSAGLNFGILETPVCCGESARKSGDEDLFLHLSETNIELFNRNRVKKIVTNSPHCYQTFQKEYRETGGEYEVVHTSQLFAEIIADGQIKLNPVANRKVTYHDPCYLGRHNEIYKAPREAINAIPGIELVEMPLNHSESLCCGGGGGRIWMETNVKERFSEIRLREAGMTGAETLVTACPYCLSNFRDSCLNQQLPEDFAAMDISELIIQAL